MKEMVEEKVLELNHEFEDMNSLFKLETSPNILPYEICLSDRDYKAVLCC